MNGVQISSIGLVYLSLLLQVTTSNHTRILASALFQAKSSMRD